jgi:hypothetical protein
MQRKVVHLSFHENTLRYSAITTAGVKIHRAPCQIIGLYYLINSKGVNTRRSAIKVEAVNFALVPSLYAKSVLSLHNKLRISKIACTPLWLMRPLFGQKKAAYVGS